MPPWLLLVAGPAGRALVTTGPTLWLFTVLRVSPLLRRALGIRLTTLTLLRPLALLRRTLTLLWAALCRALLRGTLLR